MLTGEDSPVDGKDTLREPLWVEMCTRATGRPTRGDKTQVPVLGIVQPQDRDKALASPDVSGVTMLLLVKVWPTPFFGSTVCLPVNNQSTNFRTSRLIANRMPLVLRFRALMPTAISLEKSSSC